MNLCSRLRKNAASAITALALIAGGASSARAETFNLRIASGNAPGWHFVDFTREFFIPELRKRVAERTRHRINVLEGWGGVIARATEVLESTQSGIVDLGLFCYCHEGDKLRLHNFPYYVPFGPVDPVVATRITRSVYDQTPELTQILERQYNQRLLTLIPFDTYDIVSSFPISAPSDLRGRRVGGAGPNLPWVERVGATPVSTTGAEVYTSLSTGVYSAVIAFISIMDASKLYDVAPHYTQVGFGSLGVLALHINQNTFNKLPPEVQAIVVELGREFEQVAAERTRERYQRQIIEAGQKGARIVALSAEHRASWARTLAPLPRERALELDRAGQPGTEVMRRYIAAATEAGHAWPTNYAFE